MQTGPGWYRLASFVRLALVLNVFVYAVDLVGSWWATRRLSSWLSDPTTITIEDGRTIDTLNRTTALAEVGLELVTAVLFVCWLYQAYDRPLAARSALRMSRGWAIGGWIIPLAGYVLPYRVVQGVQCATASPPRPDSQVVIGWWGAFVAFNVIGVISRVSVPDTSLDHGRRLISDLKAIEIWNVVLDVPGLVAAVLAAVVVARITAQVRAVTTDGV